MSPILLVVLVVRIIEGLFALVIAGMSVWALISALQATNYAYESASKRTKTFWVAITAACTVFSVLALLTTLRGGSASLLFQLIMATAVGVFLADVRPAVTVRRR